MAIFLAFLFLVLIVFFSKKHFPLWKSSSIGTRFRLKVAGIFSLFVIVPCLVIALFTLLFFQMGIQSWFHQKVQTALQESQDVAKAYLSEHQKVMQHTVHNMARGLELFLHRLMEINETLFSDPEFFFQFHSSDLNDYLTVNENFHKVHGIIFSVLPSREKHSPYVSFKIRSQSKFSFSLALKMIKKEILEKASKKKIFIDLNNEKNQVFAILPIFYPHTYLLVTHDIDPLILQKINHTTEAVRAYHQFLARHQDFFFHFILIFILLATIFLMTAIWAGLRFARHITEPVSALIQAAQQIRQGHSPIIPSQDLPSTQELLTLMTTFNAMTEEMNKKRQDLEKMNNCLNERSFFVESVLSGVSSGVMSLNAEQDILLSNHRALELLHLRSTEGKKLNDLVEEWVPLFQQALCRPQELLHSQGTVMCLGRPITFRLHMKWHPHIDLVILTFDDISELIEAQKKNAWADVAQRIAHEVKNPLTPIILSAERLKRRYLPTIENSKEIFQDCIETIIRQVGKIGKLINEFSSFARMPSPTLLTTDFDALIHQSITLQQQAYPHIDFIYERHSPVYIACDALQIEQVLINLFKNAIEAIEEASPSKGQIVTRLDVYEEKIKVTIRDNGTGLFLPSDQESFLCEPYTTTKPQGTGLGLTIVQKIISDHGGKFSLHSFQEGAEAVITLMKSLA